MSAPLALPTKPLEKGDGDTTASQQPRDAGTAVTDAWSHKTRDDAPNDGASKSKPAIVALPPPDHGARAWLCVAGGFCCAFCSFGWANAIGVFQDFYEQRFFPTYAPSTITWIVSLEVFCMIFGAPFVGRLYDNYGPQRVVMIGSLLHVLGLMMASLSTQYYQLILSQGICSPLGASAVFYPSVSAVVSWFQKRRALALGVMVSGSSLAGIIFPIMCQNLLPRIGFAWTVRACAFLMLGLLLFASLTVRARMPPSPRPFAPLDWVRPFREPAFLTMAVGNCFGFLAFFIPFNFVTLSALSLDTPVPVANYIIALLNVGSFFGRIFPGWVADQVGHYNMQTLMAVLTAAVILAVWIPARGEAPIIVFAILYGFTSGTFITLFPAIVAQITPDMSQIGTRTGSMFGFASFGLLIGNPVAGALITRDDDQYLYLQIFTGVIEVAAALFFILSKSLCKDRLLNRF